MGDLYLATCAEMHNLWRSESAVGHVSDFNPDDGGDLA